MSLSEYVKNGLPDEAVRRIAEEARTTARAELKRDYVLVPPPVAVALGICFLVALTLSIRNWDVHYKKGYQEGKEYAFGLERAKAQQAAEPKPVDYTRCYRVEQRGDGRCVMIGDRILTCYEKVRDAFDLIREEKLPRCELP